MSFRDFRRKSVSRRHFLKTSALTGATFALPLTPVTSRAASLKPVSVTLDWVYQGPNAGFMVAREKGFYLKPGSTFPSPRVRVRQALPNWSPLRHAKSGLSTASSLATATQGDEYQKRRQHFRRNPCSIMVFEDSPIKTAKDLEGKTVAISAGSAVIQQLPAFCKGAGVDASKIQIVNLDPAGIGHALITGKVDAIGAYVSSYVPTLEIRGKKPVRILWFSDAGVIAVSNGITMHDDLIKSDPGLVRAFVSATLKGFLYGRQHPDEAVAAVKTYQPTVDSAITHRELEVSWKLWLTPNTMGKPLGWASEADWKSTISVLHQYGGVTAPINPAELFTNEFVPAGAEYVPPQEA